MKSPRQALHDWNDARGAENIARKLAASEKPTTRELNTKLAAAVLNGNIITAEALLKGGASPDAQLSYEYGYTTYTYPLLTEMIRRNDVAMAKLLIAHKADVTKQDTFSGHSPLHEAAIYDRTPVMRAMLDTGASLEVETSIHSKENIEYLRGVTPLQIARKYAWTDVIEMLEKEPARRAAESAAKERAEREAAEENARAARSALEQAEADRIAALTAPPKTETDRDIQVSSPLRLKGGKTAKKWGLF